MCTKLKFAVFLGSFFGLPLLAEDVESVADAVSPAVQASVEGAANQEHLSEIRKRTKDLQLMQADYLKRLSEGEVTPFPEFREKLPELQAETQRLSQELADLLALKPGDPKLLEGSKTLFAALQPIGQYLQDADHAPADVRLSSTEVTMLRAIEKMDHGPSDAEEEEGELEIVGDSVSYTLLNLSVPITVKAPKGASIFFQTYGGGQFSNGLPLAKVVADKETGLASLEWSTRGDAVSEVPITISSPNAVNQIEFSIQVVQLSVELPTALLPREPSK